MKFAATTIFLAALSGVTSAVGFNSFNDAPGCNGFQEHYNLNENTKGNLASTRRSFEITNVHPGCHLKFYTGWDQKPNDASTLSFKTDEKFCYWTTDARQFRSFGFYCP
jgi:hypothetical protein